METKNSRLKENKFGEIIVSSDILKNLLLQGKNIDNSVVDIDDDIELFQKYQEDVLPNIVNLRTPTDENISIEEYHTKHSNTWIFSEEYKHINVKEWLYTKCKTQEERDRVDIEYKLFEERDLVMVLRLFISIIDYLRKNKFIWGVGRGSSVSSYILYLIGVHRVDSLKYQLDINDYLK